MAPLTTIRGFPTQPMHAWGAPGMKEVVPPSYGLEFEEYPENIREIIREIQGYIFTRRIRVKDIFLDFDPLRCGRCTPYQFVRGLNSIAPQLTAHQMRILTDFYADPVQDMMKPQVVRHLEFIRAVDGVFGGFDLEKQPVVKVPRPGHCLKKNGEDINPCDDEAAVEQTLRRLALMVKTRGVIFANCFQDAERSLDTSLLCPRFAGKVTEAQFCSHFPFMQEISEYELGLLLQRYYNSEADGINYMAMDKDLQALVEEPLQESCILGGTRSTCSGRPGSLNWSPTARLQASQDRSMAETDLLRRLKVEVASRRLRLHGSFQEVDRLRRGAVTMGQARTVFTILRIELDSKELETLHRLYDLNGLFNYREFCNQILEVPLDAKLEDLSPISASEGPPYLKWQERVRSRHPLQPDAEELLAEAEMWIARKAEHRTINVKSHFLDFDKLRCSRVTRSQFVRIMDMLQMGLHQCHLQVLMEAYCDASGREFSYLDLCNSLQRRALELGKGVQSWRRRTPEPSKYFTRKGKVIPLARPPMSARTSRPMTR